jgi:hypothetical protein
MRPCRLRLRPCIRRGASSGGRLAGDRPRVALDRPPSLAAPVAIIESSIDRAVGRSRFAVAAIGVYVRRQWPSIIGYLLCCGCMCSLHVELAAPFLAPTCNVDFSSSSFGCANKLDSHHCATYVQNYFWNSVRVCPWKMTRH